jgi:hypothetical protein
MNPNFYWLQGDLFSNKCAKYQLSNFLVFLMQWTELSCFGFGLLRDPIAIYGFGITTCNDTSAMKDHRSSWTAGTDLKASSKTFFVTTYTLLKESSRVPTRMQVVWSSPLDPNVSFADRIQVYGVSNRCLRSSYIRTTHTPWSYTFLSTSWFRVKSSCSRLPRKGGWDHSTFIFVQVGHKYILSNHHTTPVVSTPKHLSLPTNVGHSTRHSCVHAADMGRSHGRCLSTIIFDRINMTTELADGGVSSAHTFHL